MILRIQVIKTFISEQYIYIKTVRLSSFFYDELNINRRPSEKKVTITLKKTSARNAQNTVYVQYEIVAHFTFKLNKNIQSSIVVTKFYLTL